MFWTVSGEGVVWVVVGGTGTLFGPALGTALLIILREELSVHWEHFLILVGVIVIITVTFAPAGLIGILDHWSKRHRAPTQPTEAGLGRTTSRIAES
jgi:branched-chain amino acid transport system permease protein